MEKGRGAIGQGNETPSVAPGNGSNNIKGRGKRKHL